MNKLLKNWIGQSLVLAFLLLSVSTYAQTRDTLKVLFVGNSYTYFWNMPQTVQAMAVSQGFPLITRQSTAGGMSLEDHWNGNKGLKSRELISKGDWDVVVLQNHSLSTINAIDSFKEYGEKFIQLVKKSGARPMLYVTWAREYNPLMQAAITDAYYKLGKETETEVVPVGPIWSRVRELRPDLNLFHSDGSHPSPAGTYLIATTFFKALTKMGTALPNRLTSTDKDGEKIYLAIMDENDAGFIQQIVQDYEFLKAVK